MKKELGIILGLVVGVMPALAAAQQTYTVEKVTASPTIDGVRSSGEWDGANAAATGFRLLRTASPGTVYSGNLSWQAVYDSDYLYVIFETDQTDFTGATETADGTVGFTNDFEIFIDPNRDAEANVAGDANDDSYQLQIALVAGTAVRDAGAAGPPYRNAAGRSDSLFGSNLDFNNDSTADSEWPCPGLKIGRVVTSGTGATVEVGIAFADMTGKLPNGTDVGMALSGAPANGDEWLFNIAQILGSGDLPIWTYHAGDGATAYFAERPLGVMTFHDSTISHADPSWEAYK